MPTRSLNSSVLKWPDREAVESAARRWAEREASRRPNLLRLGYFGSYARGNWGVGSDLDLIAILRTSDVPREQRALDWDLTALPVPAELLVYTESEWRDMAQQAGRFARMLQSDTVWIFPLEAERR